MGAVAVISAGHGDRSISSGLRLMMYFVALFPGVVVNTAAIVFVGRIFARMRAMISMLASPGAIDCAFDGLRVLQEAILLIAGGALVTLMILQGVKMYRQSAMYGADEIMRYLASYSAR